MKQLILTANGVTAKLTLRPANVMTGLTRSRLQGEAKAETDNSRWFARYWLYTACAACSEGEIIQGETVTPVGELTFDAYFELSDAITIPWLEEAFNVNPHWMPSAPPTEDEKKKA